MASTTAQLLIGNLHPYRGGIHAIHKLELTEGSRPAWVLKHPTGTTEIRQKIWIPSIENMLDDALLMAAVHAFESAPIRATFSQFSAKIDSPRLEVVEDLTEQQRQILYAKCRALKNFPKVVLAVFSDSSIASHIEALGQYTMECEVLMPVYSRTYSAWSKQTMIEGDLALN